MKFPIIPLDSRHFPLRGTRFPRSAATALALLAAALSPASAKTILDDAQPSDKKWFFILNTALGPDGFNLSPTLVADSEGLTLRVEPWLNSTGTTQEIYDNAAIIRLFDQPVNLADGEALTFRVRMGWPTGPDSGNQIEGGINVLFLGGELPGNLPNANSFRGTHSPDSPSPNNADFEADTDKAIALGVSLKPYALKLFPVGNPATPSVGSRSLLAPLPKGFALSESPDEPLGRVEVDQKWTGGELALTIKQTSGPAPGVNYEVTIEVTGADGSIQKKSFVTSLCDDAFNYGGDPTIWGVAVTVGAGSIVFGNAPRPASLEFTISNASVEISTPK